MAQQALGTGGTMKRRAMFGLLDRDGWTWASLKALFWFLFIIFVMGYLPDRAYYFTVFSTIDLGIRNDALTPVNFCPAENQTLPCPAPAGAVLPWQGAPKELYLPAGRRDGIAVQVGTHLLYIGGTDGKAAASTVYEADLYSDGNYSAWREGPALPAPRAKLAAGFFAGSVYVVGGADASGAPTTSVYVLTPDPKTGDLGHWIPADGSAKTVPALTLPDGRIGASFVATADGIILIGGSDANGPTTSVWKSSLDKKGIVLRAWQPQAPLTAFGDHPRSDAAAILSGNEVFLIGGVDAKGPTAEILRGDLSPATSGEASRVARWGTATNASANLPAPRTDAAVFTANGALYLAGGTDGTGPKNDVWWTTPDANAAITGWKHLSVSDLPAGGLVGGSAIVAGSNAYIIGGATADGITNGSTRTSLAPKPPFFQVGGPFGMTVPALKIDGEVGQQIGYLAAAGVATGNFVLLLVIGWAFAHKERTRAILARLRRRRDHAS
jgi:N-acetylneuraminic acid mutarotase